MNIKKNGWIIIAAVLLAPFPLLSDSAWKVKKNKNGILIETRKADGYAVEEFKATATLDMPFDKAVEILRDVQNYRLWMYKLVTAKTINESSPHSKIIYMKIDLPWPAKDRDMYLQTTEKIDRQNGVFEINNIGLGGYPETECIRMTKVTITWILTGDGTDKHKTHVLYSSKGDPAGKLPAWICNLGNVDGPFENLSNLKYKYKKN
jgi:hypothetical protein